jgi:hypothetical protein
MDNPEEIELSLYRIYSQYIDRFQSSMNGVYGTPTIPPIPTQPIPSATATSSSPSATGISKQAI